MTTFPDIADYAFLSDCEISTLVAPDGSVEWLCLPRPDSPSVFGALLDRAAGNFHFGPSGIDVPNQRRYVPGTNVLETTWHTPTGWLIVWDMLVMGPAPTDERRDRYRRVPGDTMGQGTLLRIATCCDGRVEVQADCVPQFDYGRENGEWTYDDGGYERVTVRWKDIALDLTGSLRLGILGPRTYGRTTLEEGESAWLALSWEGDAPTTLEEAKAQRDATEKYWRDWLALAKIHDHVWRPYLERSALALKSLSYAPTGAIMAAGTTSLPESPGGERNWDYRYTWIRDTAFMLRALHDLGFEWEAFEYFAFLLETLSSEMASGEPNLQIMYGIGGETDLTEHTLDHLSGYRNSQPVRVGNGAFDQHQHDVWGMLLDAFNSFQRRGGQIQVSVWDAICYLVNQAVDRFPEPDQGIWEMRGDPQHFVASKVMCWVAVDRGLHLAREREDHELIERWEAAAEKMQAEILDQGTDDRGVFTQYYGTKALDASNLLIPIMGFLPGDDDRVRATVLAIADELTKDGLVLRYRVETTDDGLSGEEGTFTICSFWLVSALTIIGEVDRARALFQKLLSFSGPLHLYAEEIDATTGQHLGNFPQAFTHLALIDAGRRLIEIEIERESI